MNTLFYIQTAGDINKQLFVDLSYRFYSISGILVFDDLDFIPTELVGIYKDSTARQLKTPQIQMMCDVLVSRFNYEILPSPRKNWAVYRKL